MVPAGQSLQARFVELLLDQDWGALRDQLAEGVRYRGVTSSRVTEAEGAEASIAGLQVIFDDGDVVTAVEGIDDASMPPVHRLTYRFQTVVPASGVRRQAEQHVFIRLDDGGKIGKIDLICSGWLPVPGGQEE